MANRKARSTDAKVYSFFTSPLLLNTTIDVRPKILVRSGWAVTLDQHPTEALDAVDKSPLGSILVIDGSNGSVVGAVTTSNSLFKKCKKKKRKPCENECTAKWESVNCPVDQRYSILAPDGCHCFCGDTGPEIPDDATVEDWLFP